MLYIKPDFICYHIKFSARCRCPQDRDISLSRIDTLQKHLRVMHGSRKGIVILGGGFAGVAVLNKLPKLYHFVAFCD
jgi:hypothetical protein